LYEFKISGFAYFKDVWNIIDFSRVILSFAYLIAVFSDGDTDDEDLRLVFSLAVLLNWTRIIGFYRFFNPTRYLIRMIIEISKGMVPFLLIFLSFVFALAFSYMALRGDDLEFIAAW
jgi:hypothetical protein